jgi:zona occludens toxin
MLEWPEYVSNPSVKYNRDQAVTVPFKVRSEAFSLYHSGQHHTKLKQRKPLQLYFTLFLFLLMPVLLYYAYAAVTKNRAEPQPEEKIVVAKQPENSSLLSALAPVPVSAPVPVLNPASVTVSPSTKKFDSIVSADYDWSGVSACLSSKNYGCVCYGQSGHRLAVPADMCESAITYGWPKSSRKS